ncbi:MAG TPA: VTT domain-containing protein [Bryobacteraceae bacterium]
MSSFFHHLFGIFIALGPFGLILFSLLESFILVLPFGNDILLIVLVASKPSWLPIYVAGAAVGSTIGAFLMDLMSRKGGEEGLRKLLKPDRFNKLKKMLSKRAPLALLVACLAPPPFPFRPVVAAASAFQYPRRRMLVIVLVGRTLRFALLGLAAWWFGRRVLSIVQSKAFMWFAIGLIAFCAAASAISIYRLLKSRGGRLGVKQ